MRFTLALLAILACPLLAVPHGYGQSGTGFDIDVRDRYVDAGDDIVLEWACDFSVVDYRGMPMDAYLVVVRNPTFHDTQMSVNELLSNAQSRDIFALSDKGLWVPAADYDGNPCFSDVVFGPEFSSGTLEIGTPESDAYDETLIFCATIVPAGTSLQDASAGRRAGGKDSPPGYWPVMVSQSVNVNSPAPTALQKLQGWFPANIKGMCYQPNPTDYFTPGPPVKYGNTDYYNIDFKALWGIDAASKTRTVHFPDNSTKSQGDLQTLKDMGVNLIRLYGWQSGHAGDTPWVDHEPFLAECDRLGIKVIVPIYIDYGDVSYGNIPFTVKMTKNHPCVVMYSVGNEISKNQAGGAPNPAWDLLRKFATRLKAVMAEQGATQLVISPTWPSTEAMDWFIKDSSAGFSVDAWAFNAYNPDQVKSVHDMASGRLIHGKPYFFSEFGTDAYNNATNLQDETTHQSDGQKALAAVKQYGDQGFGGCWFEWSDERSKGLDSTLGAGGGHDGTPTAPTYVSQVGGSIKTWEGGADQTVPAGSIGTCTYGWKVSTLWFADGVCNEGYLGLGYFRDATKTAKTVKLQAYPPGGGAYPYIYRVDDLYLRKLYTDFRNWSPKP
jgi:hypothetical protein